MVLLESFFYLDGESALRALREGELIYEFLGYMEESSSAFSHIDPIARFGIFFDFYNIFDIS